MAVDSVISDEILTLLGRLDTCKVAAAIERFNVRLRNAGFANAGIRCMFADLAPVVGYAATARLRSGEPPMTGASYHDRTDWWNSLLQGPAPRIVVLEDRDTPPGTGALVGDVHAAILRALNCVAYVTNGAVRELPRVRELGLQLFAGNVAVSHAYAHIFDVGATVTVGGLEINAGDLLHGDQHGLISVPREIASQIPEVAARLQQSEETLIAYCQSREFSVEGLRHRLAEVKG